MRGEILIYEMSRFKKDQQLIRDRLSKFNEIND